MRKLYLDNGDQKFKFSDTTTEIHLNTFENGIETTPTADAKVRIKNESGYLMEISASIRDNHAVFTSGQLARLPVGSYLIELWDNVKGGTAIYPSDGFLALQINENVTGLSGGIISSITVDDFVQQFNGLGKQLKKEVADAVDNGVKGDTGPQGPQGPQGPRGPAGEDGTQVDLTEYAKITEVTNAINTATDNMADTTKLSNFTAGLQSGGVDVATAADLKSVEDKAWRVLDNKYITAFDKYNTSIKVDENSLLLAKIDEVNKRVYMFFTILGNFVTNSTIYIDLTSIVKNISFPNYYVYNLLAGTESSHIDSYIAGNRICFDIGNDDTIVLNSRNSAYMVNSSDTYWTYSSCFVNYDELV